MSNQYNEAVSTLQKAEQALKKFDENQMKQTELLL